MLFRRGRASIWQAPLCPRRVDKPSNISRRWHVLPASLMDWRTSSPLLWQKSLSRSTQLSCHCVCLPRRPICSVSISRVVCLIRRRRGGSPRVTLTRHRSGPVIFYDMMSVFTCCVLSALAHFCPVWLKGPLTPKSNNELCLLFNIGELDLTAAPRHDDPVTEVSPQSAVVQITWTGHHYRSHVLSMSVHDYPGSHGNKVLELWWSVPVLL